MSWALEVGSCSMAAGWNQRWAEGMRHMALITSVLSSYPWKKRERNGIRKGYRGSFNWAANVLFLKKTCEKNKAKCEFLKKLDGRCMHVYYSWYFSVFLNYFKIKNLGCTSITLLEGSLDWIIMQSSNVSNSYKICH